VLSARPVPPLLPQQNAPKDWGRGCVPTEARAYLAHPVLCPWFGSDKEGAVGLLFRLRLARADNTVPASAKLCCGRIRKHDNAHVGRRRRVVRARRCLYQAQ
jgi:hypothetical protein